MRYPLDEQAASPETKTLPSEKKDQPIHSPIIRRLPAMSTIFEFCLPDFADYPPSPALPQVNLCIHLQLLETVCLVNALPLVLAGGSCKSRRTVIHMQSWLKNSLLAQASFPYPFASFQTSINILPEGWPTLLLVDILAVGPILIFASLNISINSLGNRQSCPSPQNTFDFTVQIFSKEGSLS